MIEPSTTNLLQQVAIYPLPVYNCYILIPGGSRWLVISTVNARGSLLLGSRNVKGHG